MAQKIEERAEGIEYYNFKSPFSGTDNIDLKPLNVSFSLRKENDNSDLKDEKMKSMYDKIEYIGNVLIKLNHRDILGVCKDTGIAFSIEQPILRSDMLEFLKKRGIEPIMRLNR